MSVFGMGALSAGRGDSAELGKPEFRGFHSARDKIQQPPEYFQAELRVLPADSIEP